MTIILSIPRGQLIGSSIEHALLILLGIYLLLIWPRIVQRQIASGKLTEADREAKFKKFSPKWGYVALALSVGGIIFDLTT